MPELTWRYGSPAAMIGVSAVAALSLAAFRRHGWI